mmetsp:Transcript_5131/g.7146  ORF Transcript_5131/g.7146 Transcript_5131/m.7146 type:complete len:116 (-) Transcript_5131:279-626(-)
MFAQITAISARRNARSFFTLVASKDIQDLNKTVVKIEERLSGLEAKVANMETKVVNIEEKVSGLEKSLLEKLETKAAQLTADFQSKQEEKLQRVHEFIGGTKVIAYLVTACVLSV